MKKLHIKSYDSDGVFIKTFVDFKIDYFTKKINSGISQLTITLARKFDTFNTNSDVSLGNKLELWLSDEDTGTTPIKLYVGYVEQHIPKITTNGEYVDILCLSIASYLVQDILKSAAYTTLYTKATVGLTITLADIAAAEIANVLTAIIDYFRTANPTLKLNYSDDAGDTIDTTGNTLKYTFTALQYSEAIKICKNTAPQNWYWYIDENEIFSFNTIPLVATHTFTIGRDISKIEVNKGIDSVKNVVLIFDGVSTYKQYKDDASIDTYGRRVRQINDSGIKDETTMNNVGASFIAENKDPRIRIVMEIADNNENNLGYNIESIQPGETCKIAGINISGDLFTENMIIQEVEWVDKYARIIIETRQDFDFDVFLLKLRKDVNQQFLTDTPPPASYS